MQPDLYVIACEYETPHSCVLVLNARDAWIQADANRYNGVNKCLLWRAFASKGMGVFAADHNNSFSVPDGC